MNSNTVCIEFRRSDLRVMATLCKQEDTPAEALHFLATFFENADDIEAQTLGYWLGDLACEVELLLREDDDDDDEARADTPEPAPAGTPATQPKEPA